MSNFFEKIEEKLKTANLRISSKDLIRPWGGFYLIDESQAQEFSNLFFNRMDLKKLT